MHYILFYRILYLTIVTLKSCINSFPFLYLSFIMIFLQKGYLGNWNKNRSISVLWLKRPIWSVFSFLDFSSISAEGTALFYQFKEHLNFYQNYKKVVILMSFMTFFIYVLTPRPLWMMHLFCFENTLKENIFVVFRASKHVDVLLVFICALELRKRTD